MSSKYKEFDALLLSEIRSGNDTFSAMQTAKVREAAELFSARPYEEFRVIDRRLQALRKAGAITYAGGRWRVIDS
ncbi:hypothetical protein G5B41_17520 [bacterium SGD-2]|nr:hypothetical protein [bacterium SGD-2]